MFPLSLQIDCTPSTGTARHRLAPDASLGTSCSILLHIPLGFLAPRIIEAIAEGRQPPKLTVEALTRRIDLPLLWSAQHQALGIE